MLRIQMQSMTWYQEKLMHFCSLIQTWIMLLQNGTPIVALKPYAFMGYSGIAVEKGDGNSTVSFVEKLNDIVQKMHTEGFLSSIYMKNVQS